MVEREPLPSQFEPIPKESIEREKKIFLQKKKNELKFLFRSGCGEEIFECINSQFDLENNLYSWWNERLKNLRAAHEHLRELKPIYFWDGNQKVIVASDEKTGKQVSAALSMQGKPYRERLVIKLSDDKIYYQAGVSGPRGHFMLGHESLVEGAALPSLVPKDEREE